MAFLPPDDAEERILLYGGPGAGKSYCWLGIADMYAKTRTEGHFWVVDNDRAAKRMLRSYPKLEPYVTAFTPSNFDDYKEISDRILSECNPNDWIVIDMISNVWEGMPNWWLSHVYDDDSWSYWANVRKDMMKAEENDKSDSRSFGGYSGVDWQYIKKAYYGWETPMTRNAPCHVIALASEKEVVAHFDKGGEKGTKYAAVGKVAPVCEKMTPHRFHTEMRIVRRMDGGGRKVASREITVVKDRDREDIWEEVGGRGRTIELSDGPRFATDYLKKIGGWKVGRGE